MSTGFEAARDAMNASLSSQESNQGSSDKAESYAGGEQSTGNGIQSQERQNSQQQQSVQDQIVELEKHFGEKKFKFNGQEMTLKELQAAYMRQKDYTTKTQSLAEERKKWETERASEQKYYDNLHWDLEKIKANPQLVQEFIKTYPQKFHQYAEQVLANTQRQQPEGSAQRPIVDVNTLSRMERLEKFVNDQEISKNEAQIMAITSQLQQKYPKAKEQLVLPVAYELAEKKGEQLSEAEWEDIYKTAHTEMENLIKAEMASLQKKQTEANSKARDVGGGGGTIGQAPKKFKTFREITENAVSSLTGKN